MAGGPERLAKGTRGRILGLLRRSERTIAELAAEVGISDNAVRTHMAGLERDGLVRARGEARATGGKPAQVYELAEAGRELFARAYARFLAAALAVLADREGATGARRVLREVGRRVAGTLPEARGDLRARVEAAAAALRSLGGDVDVEASAEGFRLRGHGCPLGAVVTVEPAACLMAESLVAALVGTPVAERCDRRDPPRCLFEVRRAGGGRR